MSLLSRLFGGGDRPLRVPRPELVTTIRFTYDRVRRSTRHLANVELVRAGTYRIEPTSTGTGAYAPEGPFAPLPEGGWRHAVHMLCCTPAYPLTAADGEPAGSLRHILFHNPADPGPHATSHEARYALRTLPEEALTFTIPEDTRLVFWIEADHVPGEGVLELRLLRLP